jgi:hypothetical protein
MDDETRQAYGWLLRIGGPGIALFIGDVVGLYFGLRFYMVTVPLFALPILLIFRKTRMSGAMVFFNSVALFFLVSASVGRDRCLRCASTRFAAEYRLLIVSIINRYEDPKGGAPRWTGLPDPATCRHGWKKANRCTYTFFGIA